MRVSAGVRYSSALVRDSIVTPFSVRAEPAPTLAGIVRAPLERGWTLEAALDATSSHLKRHDADGSSSDLGRLSSVSFVLGLRHSIRGGLSGGAGIGGLKYFPAERTGIFRLGTGSLASLGSVTLDYRVPRRARIPIAVAARYDVHGFTTPALDEEGFGSRRAVHRVALSLQLGVL